MRVRPKMRTRSLILALTGAVVAPVLTASQLTPGGSTAAISWFAPKQSIDFPSYWESRKIVSVLAHCDSSGAVESVEIFDNEHTESVEDSLIELVSEWTFPPKTRGPREGRSFTEDVHFVFDRSASTVPDRAQRGLPQIVTDALEEEPLKSWVDAWAASDLEFALTDFVTPGYTKMRVVEAEGMLHSSEQMKKKRRYGLLHTSPDGAYVLDPFVGGFVDKRGEIGWDIDQGYSVFDAETGDRLYYHVDTRSHIGMAHWINPRIFVLTGRFIVDNWEPSPGIWVHVSVPEIRVGDIEAEKIARYWGAPAGPHEMAGEPWKELQEVKTSVYPAIEW